MNLNSAVAYRFNKAGKEPLNPEIALSNTSLRELRVITDETAIAFDQNHLQSLPCVNLLFNPVHMLFVANGQAPFILAVGKKEAANVLCLY
ncbi:MAG: DUF3999 family protein [Methylophilaceae bacterium]|nr:DUF3999 family protein [Methylophilaceae bacterium]